MEKKQRKLVGDFSESGVPMLQARAVKQAVKTVGNLTLYKEVGRGMFAVVFKGKHKSHVAGTDDTGNKVAVKEISRKQLNDKMIDALMKEVGILGALSSENIIKLYAVKKTVNHVYIVVEYCSGGDLSVWLEQKKRCDEATLHRMVCDISNGLRLLSQHGILHRDLKLSNVFRATKDDHAVIKIGDFGFARFLAPNENAQTSHALDIILPFLLLLF